MFCNGYLVIFVLSGQPNSLSVWKTKLQDFWRRRKRVMIEWSLRITDSLLYDRPRKRHSSWREKERVSSRAPRQRLWWTSVSEGDLTGNDRDHVLRVMAQLAARWSRVKRLHPNSWQKCSRVQRTACTRNQIPNRSRLVTASLRTRKLKCCASWWPLLLRSFDCFSLLPDSLDHVLDVISESGQVAWPPLIKPPTLD